MEKSKVKKLLIEHFGDKYIYSEEYQDKYYLCKEIREKLPEIPENLIYEAINQVNAVAKSPVKGKKFVEIFIDKLMS